jgi:hypothetical protein
LLFILEYSVSYIFVKLLVLQVHVVVEAVLDGWTIAEASAIGQLHGLAHQVSSRVPEHILALLVVELQQLEVAVALERPIQVPELVVDLGNHCIVGEALADLLGYLVRSGAPRLAGYLFTIGQHDLDRLGLLGRQLGLVLLHELVPDGQSVLNKIRSWLKLVVCLHKLLE